MTKPIEAIYLAARFERQEEVRSLARLFQLHGYLITSTWLRPEVTLSVGTERAPALAEQDVADILRADALVLLTEDPTLHPNRGGKDVELGIAYQAGKRVCVCGPRVNVFHHLPRVRWYPRLADLLEAFDVGAKVAEIGESAAP